MDAGGTPVMTVVRHSTRRRFTGVTFGRRGGALFARVYDKTAEAKSDAPIREAWRAAGYDPSSHGEAVWRVEFEARGELLRSLKLADGSSLPVADPEKLLRENLGHLWGYMTNKWLVLREDDGRTRVERSKPQAWWSKLSEHQTIGHPAETLSAELFRCRPVPLDSKRLLQQAMGVLVGLGACNGSEDLDEVLATLSAHAHEAVGGELFAEKVAAVGQIKP
jgi:hypothetical protein